MLGRCVNSLFQRNKRKCQKVAKSKLKETLGMSFRRKMTVWITGFACFLIFPDGSSISYVESPRLRIQFEGDPESYYISAVTRDQVLYVSLDEFADVLGFRRYSNPQNGRTTIHIGSHLIKVSPFNHFLMINDSILQMALPTMETNDKLYVPLEVFLGALGNHIPFRFDLQQEGMLLRLSKVAYNITGFTAEARTRWLIDTIVIDPGHGGRDPGAIGKSGIREKEITLQIGLRLRTLLRRRLPRVKILMTRDTDVFVGLKERTQYANANGGKLFISIHANANESRSVRGFTIYILGVGKTQIAVDVAQKENSVITYEKTPEVYEGYQDFDYILNAIALNSYIKESKDFAIMVTGSMNRFTKIPDLGVHQAGFYVLIGASMPNILVETAFLSNVHEERLLKTNSFQQKIAEALCESIENFKKRHEKEIG